MAKWRIEWQAGGELLVELPEQDVNGDAYDYESINSDIGNATLGIGDDLAEDIADELGITTGMTPELVGGELLEADGTIDWKLTRVDDDDQ